MDKANSGKLFEQAANQNNEADSHAHKILDEVAARDSKLTATITHHQQSAW
jgi:hypothetical protein